MSECGVCTWHASKYADEQGATGLRSCRPEAMCSAWRTPDAPRKEHGGAESLEAPGRNAAPLKTGKEALEREPQGALEPGRGAAMGGNKRERTAKGPQERTATLTMG